MLDDVEDELEEAQDRLTRMTAKLDKLLGHSGILYFCPKVGFTSARASSASLFLPPCTPTVVVNKYLHTEEIRGYRLL